LVFVSEAVRQLKQPGGNLILNGSATLEYLRQRKLLDEYRLLVFLLVLGSGKQLFILKVEPLACIWWPLPLLVRAAARLLASVG
jgi:dihydrofolate reductase